VSPRSLHPGTGTDSDRVTRLTTYCREHAPSLANMVFTTPVRPPGTLCHLTYRTLLTLTYLRNDLKLFCLIVRTDLLLLLYGAPGRFVERRLTNLSLYCIVFTVPNVTAHPSTASVSITVLLYNCPLLCDFNVPIKGLNTRHRIVSYCSAASVTHP